MYIQQEIEELECFYLNEIVCKDGIYDNYEGSSNWKQTHSSITSQDELRVYTRKRHTGEE